MSLGTTAHYPLTLEEWKHRISKRYLNAQFETELLNTYAHIGPDIQSDVVGVWVPGSHCSIDDTEYGVSE